MKPFVPKDDWPRKQRPNLTAKIPYCYKLDPDDDHYFVPDLEIVKAVEMALDYLDDNHSLRETAAWLCKIAQKPITMQGLDYIWHQKRGKNRSSPRYKALKARREARQPKTPEEALARQATAKIGIAKRQQAKAERDLEQLVKKRQQEVEKLVQVNHAPTTVIPDIPVSKVDKQHVLFEPNPGPQTEFLASSEQELLFGGAAGGGKSYGIIADVMRYFDNPNFRGIIVRRTTDELREIKWKSRELYTKAFPGIIWREKDSVWRLPSGAELWLTYLERDEDVLRYQGQTFTYIAFDELTQYPTSFAWDYMRSRLRTTDPTLPLFMRATTNPGGPGHGWVKRMFVDPAPPGQAFPARDLETNKPLVWEEGNMAGKTPGTPLFYRRFIPAGLKDNPYLMRDGQYEANLRSLPEAQRRKLLDGDWSVIEGAAFPEFQTKTHVVDPKDFPVHKNWRRFRSCDYGYNSFSAVHWYAIDPTYETLVVYRELYVTGMTGKALAREILRIEAEHEEKMLYGMLDSSVWHQRGQVGPSIAEEMIAEGCRWRPSDRSAGSRSAGKNRLHELLKVNDYGSIQLPGIVFYNTCRQIIADLQVIPIDPNGNEDIDPKYTSDHAYDSIRYGIMSRPRGMSPFDSVPQFVRTTYAPADRTFGY